MLTLSLNDGHIPLSLLTNRSASSIPKKHAKLMRFPRVFLFLGMKTSTILPYILKVYRKHHSSHSSGKLVKKKVVALPCSSRHITSKSLCYKLCREGSPIAAVKVDGDFSILYKEFDPRTIWTGNIGNSRIQFKIYEDGYWVKESSNPDSEGSKMLNHRENYDMKKGSSDEERVVMASPYVAPVVRPEGGRTRPSVIGLKVFAAKK